MKKFTISKSFSLGPYTKSYICPICSTSTYIVRALHSTAKDWDCNNLACPSYPYSWLDPGPISYKYKPNW